MNKNGGINVPITTVGKRNEESEQRKRYYFITYEYKKHDHMKEWDRSNLVVEKHPIKWLKDMIDQYSEVEQYHILFYSEIEKEQFDLINGWIN